MMQCNHIKLTTLNIERRQWNAEYLARLFEKCKFAYWSIVRTIYRICCSFVQYPDCCCFIRVIYERYLYYLWKLQYSRGKYRQHSCEEVRKEMGMPFLPLKSLNTFCLQRTVIQMWVCDPASLVSFTFILHSKV